MKKWLKRLYYVIAIITAISALFSVAGLYFSPEEYTFLAFFSIAYLIIFVFFAVIAIIGIWVHKKWFFVMGAMVVLFSLYLPRFYQINIFEDEVPKENLKVMSYNLRLFNLYDWRNNIQTRNQIFQFLKKESPDIACFQEFYHQKNSITFPTKDTILQLMPWKYYQEKYTHEMKNEQFFGVATFSKYPIINKGEIPFINDDNNFCIYSDMVWNNDTIRVFNAHIGSIRFKKEDYEFFGDENKIHPEDEGGRKIITRLKKAFQNRAQQIQAIEEEVQKSPYNVILCLDMNDSPMSFAYQTMQNNLKDAFTESGQGSGATYIGKIPSFRIDYIFHSPELKSGGFITHQEELSDHRAISCSIY